MCSIAKTYIPEKHIAWWNMHRNSIMMHSGKDDSVWNMLLSIGYTK